MRSPIKPLLALGPLISLSAARSTVHTVPTDYPSIQEAIAAAVDGDTVLVLPGTYFENLSYLGKGITLTGSKPEDWGVVEGTVVDARGEGSVVSLHDEEPPSTVLQGLTLTGGTGSVYHVGPWRGRESYGGGGVFCTSNSQLTIDRCLIRDNHVYGGYARGGGVYVGESSRITVVRTQIEQNTVTSEIHTGSGGGVYFDDGDGTIRHSTIADNHAASGGGGLEIDVNAGAVTLVGTKVVGNEAEYAGGVFVISSSLRVLGCVFESNHSNRVGGYGGGAMRWTSGSRGGMVNCVVSNNTGNGNCGGIDCDTFSSPVFLNCTFADNSAATGSGTAIKVRLYSHPVVRNSIIWGNGSSPIDAWDDSSITLEYTNIEHGWPGEGNINADPLFARPLGGYEYLLRPSSPCVDSGDPDTEDAISDWHPLWPQWYPNAARADMGAYGGRGNEIWLRGLKP